MEVQACLRLEASFSDAIILVETFLSILESRRDCDAFSFFFTILFFSFNCFLNLFSFAQGVMMTHGNIVSTVSAVMTIIPNIGKNDVYLAYLPMAHILELIAEVYVSSNTNELISI